VHQYLQVYVDREAFFLKLFRCRQDNINQNFFAVLGDRGVAALVEVKAPCVALMPGKLGTADITTSLCPYCFVGGGSL
jgi:hypothetical protein